MKYKVGDRIRFRYTGEAARIIKDFGDNSYRVEVFSGTEDERIAFAEDILPEAEFRAVEESPTQKEMRKKKGPSTEELFYGKQGYQEQESKKQEPVQEEYYAGNSFQYGMAEDEGLQVLLLQEGAYYCIYLANDTKFSFEFSFRIDSGQGQFEQSLKKSILARDFFILGAIAIAQLNEAPKLCIDIPFFKEQFEQRLGSKIMRRKKQEIALLGVEAVSLLCLHPEKQGQKTKQELSDLRDYTERILKEKKAKEQKKQKGLKPSQPQTAISLAVERANFKHDIDLHIEHLHSSPNKLKDFEKLDLQIRAFEHFLAQAIRLEIRETLYVIHGVGTGRLRGEIAHRLRGHPRLLNFVNEHHPKYGYGATEFQLKR